MIRRASRCPAPARCPRRPTRTGRSSASDPHARAHMPTGPDAVAALRHARTLAHACACTHGKWDRIRLCAGPALHECSWRIAPWPEGWRALWAGGGPGLFAGALRLPGLPATRTPLCRRLAASMFIIHLYRRSAESINSVFFICPRRIPRTVDRFTRQRLIKESLHSAFTLQTRDHYKDIVPGF